MAKLILGNDLTVLSAFAILADVVPGSTEFKIHKQYIKDYNMDGYVAALNKIFSGYTDGQLASLFLNGIDLGSIKIDPAQENLKVITDFVTANAGNRVGALLQLAEQQIYYTNDAKYASVKANFQAQIEASYNYSINDANTIVRSFDSMVEQSLSTAQDKLTGTPMDDFFKAYIFDNQNTLQSGDIIDGGAGYDTLYADIGNSQNFAITPETKSVEHVKIRAQSNYTEGKDNNLTGKAVQLDAQRMKEVLNWENNNSRTDLVVEDVRIKDEQITKDITITMRETDPGHVDFGLYFDQNSLRNVTSAKSQLNLRVLDTYATSQGKDALLQNPNVAFHFYANEKGKPQSKFVLYNEDMHNATTLEQMRDAMQKAADDLFGANALTVKLGSSYSVTDPVSSKTVSGKEINIVANGDITFDVSKAGSGWEAKKVLPTPSGTYTNYNTDITKNTDLVTSKVILDYVGRGSTGGDLVIGGLSTGDTSTSKGVQRFEITVEDDSTLRKISSTNNSLREVSIVNGEQTRMPDAYNGPQDPAGGKLVVKGEMAPNSTVTSAENTTLPGGSQSAYGFQDVRVIDGSAMTGKLEFNAELTAAAVGKYVTKTDTQKNPLDDNIKVIYQGGSNNDKMWVNIDQHAVASHSNFKAGLADFEFLFEGGKGNDEFNIAIDRVMTVTPDASTKTTSATAKLDLTGFDVIQASDAGVMKGGLEFWYHNQRSNGQYKNSKLVIDGGEGNDTIKKPGAGDFKIVAGAGNDVIYADNTGAQTIAAGNALDGSGAPAAAAVYTKAAWLFNTEGNVATNNAALNAYNPKSVVTKTVGSYGVEVQVNYRGLKSVKVALDDTQDFQTNQLEINQAIKKAINDDAVLNKLLVANDNASGVLMVQALTDDVHDANSLTVTFSNSLKTHTEITAAVLDGYIKANGKDASTFTAEHMAEEINENVGGLIGGVTTTVNTPTVEMYKGYTTKLALDNNLKAIAGAKSVTSSDNWIDHGVGDDVIVLGTTVATYSAVDGALDTLRGALHSATSGGGANAVAEADKVFAALNAIPSCDTVAEAAAANAVLDAVLTNATNAFLAGSDAAAIKTAATGTANIGAAALSTAINAVTVTTSAESTLANIEAIVNLSKSALEKAVAASTGFDAAAVVLAFQAAMPTVGAQTDAYYTGAQKGDLLSSNDVVVFNPDFGKDVILNFQATGHGADKLDFTALGGKSATFTKADIAATNNAQSVQDGQIYLAAFSSTGANKNHTAEEVKKLYSADGVQTKAISEVYVAVDGGSGTVYKVTDGTAANDLTVELMGTLTIGGAVNGTAAFNWGTLDVGNFA